MLVAREMKLLIKAAISERLPRRYSPLLSRTLAQIDKAFVSMARRASPRALLAATPESEFSLTRHSLAQTRSFSAVRSYMSACGLPGSISSPGHNEFEECCQLYFRRAEIWFRYAPGWQVDRRGSGFALSNLWKSV
jgi:hypothetical protein